MTPEKIVISLKEKGLSTAQISRFVGCTNEYVNKIGSGARKKPNYIVVDRLRALLEQPELARDLA
jgi:putative phage associated protein